MSVDEVHTLCDSYLIHGGSIRILKTIVPSRKARRDYQRKQDG
jgi:hypothetical protein